jgi:type IX secretion system PorP/SprF family membrane protein
MKTILQTTVFLILIVISTNSNGQQDAMYTHYMYNTLAVNPAYAGSRDALTITALHRSQWVDFPGAPTTQSLTLHSPLKSKNIGLGLSAINDKAGPIKNMSVYGDFAYTLKLTEKSKLSFGLKGGINLMQANLTSLLIQNETDESFQRDYNSKVLPNFGFGMYYARERFYAGISVPKLLENNFRTKEAGQSTMIGKEQRHYYFIAGAVFRLSETVELKPTTFVKVTMAVPIEADLTSTFIIHKKLLLGAMFRTGDAIGLLLGYNITEQFHIGYSFDWSYGLRTFKYNNGTHEIMLSYDFIFKDKGNISSPRYF